MFLKEYLRTFVKKCTYRNILKLLRIFVGDYILDEQHIVKCHLRCVMSQSVAAKVFKVPHNNDAFNVPMTKTQYLSHMPILSLLSHTYTILPKVLAPLLMNRFDYFSNFYEYKS